jgi:methionyl-tRNA formyltransferase
MTSAAPPRIVFAGTPEFAVPALRGLIAAGHPPVAVYTQPDRPAGRGRAGQGRKLRPSPVKQCALDAGIPVFQSTNLRDPENRHRLAELAPDLMIVIAYGLLLPPVVLDIPRLGCVNVHASLLPRWRGAAPIQRALLAGDRETGVCLMRMDAGLDTGPVLARAVCPITPDMTGGELHDRLAALGAELLVGQLLALLAGTLPPQAQDDSQATYAAKLNKAEAELDWRRPAVELARRINAFNPWPVAWTTLDGEPLRLWRASALAIPATAPPGQVLRPEREALLVATGDGVLQLLELQAAGRRPLPAAEFIKARPLAGLTLGRS